MAVACQPPVTFEAKKLLHVTCYSKWGMPHPRHPTESRLLCGYKEVITTKLVLAGKRAEQERILFGLDTTNKSPQEALDKSGEMDVYLDAEMMHQGCRSWRCQNQGNGTYH